MAKKTAKRRRRQEEGSQEDGGEEGRGEEASGDEARIAKSARRSIVYLFGRKTDGNGTMKPLLGGKGANLAEMCRIGLPVPPASRSPPKSARTTTPTSARIRRRCSGQMEAGIAALETADRQEVRRPEEPAARLGALRRARLDAGHDGHDPQPRPQRPDGRGARRRRPATRASPGTATAASCRCTATSCSACRSVPTRITSRSRR